CTSGRDRQRKMKTFMTYEFLMTGVGHIRRHILNEPTTPMRTAAPAEPCRMISDVASVIGGNAGCTRSSRSLVRLNRMWANIGKATTAMISFGSMPLSGPLQRAAALLEECAACLSKVVPQRTVRAQHAQHARGSGGVLPKPSSSDRASGHHDARSLLEASSAATL